MALDNLLVLAGGPGVRSRPRSLSKPASSHPTTNQEHFEDAEPTREQGVQPLEVPSDDYEIALVAHMNRVRQPHSINQPSTPVERVLLLSLTWRELLERVSKESGRSNPSDRSRIAEFGDVHVNFANMEVRRSNQPVVLTSRAFKLLRFLAQSPHQVFSRDQLLNEVWGYNHYPSTRTVDNHIFVLRKKLELDPTRPIHFLTVHGSGYKFVP